MNKLVAVLCVVIVLLAALCGILYYQIGDMQSQNSELQNQISGLENQNSVLEGQVSEYQNQTEQLETQIRALESEVDYLSVQNSELQKEISHQEYLKAVDVSKASQVKITGFKITQTGNPVLMALQSFVNVTVQNFGTSDVEVLNLSVKHVSGDYIDTIKPIGPILAGETKIVRTWVWWDYEVDADFVATLVVHDVTVDTYYP